MATVATTRMSSKGQVVIPEEVRKALSLEVGAQFVVMGDGDTVVLKRIGVPAKSELRAMLSKVRSQARRAGVKPSDVGDAIRRARRGR
jgi:AbrB family looped-hinge helix DNA binding protein